MKSFGKIIFDTKGQNTIPRNSNMELLRIVCMFMIVLRHFIIHPLNGGTLLGTSIIGGGIDALCYIAVNCFILISGWFGITFKWRRLLNLFIMCSFYGVVSYVFHLGNSGASVGRTLLFVSLMPFSHSCWWFINAYVFLYLCTPLINLAMENVKGEGDITILLLLTMINVYFGNIMQTPLFNDNGYNAQQMVYLYWMGGVLRRRVSLAGGNKQRVWWLFGYITLSAAWFISRLLKESYGLEFIHLGYNNLMTIGASVFFFLFVASFQFTSKIVNFVASSALAVYLIQESAYFGYEWLYPFVGRLFDAIPWAWQPLSAIVFSFLFFVACVLVDQIRKVLSELFFRIIDRTPLLNRM